MDTAEIAEWPTVVERGEEVAPGGAQGERRSGGPVGQWRDVGTDITRAFSGGMIFGVPLLFTMEVWHVGAQASPPQLTLALIAVVAPVFLLVRLVGFWSTPARRLSDALVQTVQAAGIAVVSVTAVLVVLGRLTWPMPLSDAVGMVVHEAIPFAVGAAVASAAVHGSPDEGPEDAQPQERTNARATLRDLGAAAIGALFIGLSIAPTDEVPVLTAGIPTAGLLAVIGLSLAVSYTVVFASGFLNQRKRRTQLGVLQRPLAETLASYLVALLVSALMLWVFGNLGTGEPLEEVVSRVLVLGLPAAVGGSAGRLVA